MAQIDDRLGHGGGSRIIGKIADEGLIDLELVHGQAAQVAERGVAGAEVVDGEPTPISCSSCRMPGSGVQIVQEGRFGQFQFQPLGSEPSPLERLRDD